jgi:hypothetical protein
MILATHGVLASSGGSFLLLDLYPNASVAYSLRKLSSIYTGNAIRVRRSSDNAEQDIGFSSGNLNTTDLTAFCSSGNGFITTWNDQSGNVKNGTQATAINQPQIVSSGTIFTSGSKSAIQNASTRGTKTNTIAFSSYSEIWLYAVVDVTTTTTQVIFESSPNFNTPVGSFLILIDGGRLVVLTRNSTYSGVSCPITTGRKLISIKIKTNTTATLAYDIYINGALQTKTIDNNTNTVSFSDQILSLLSRDGNSVGFTNKSQELIIFTGDQSANNSGISTNINTYYGIY